MGRPRHVSLKVWGDFACFTNPAFSVERWSYPVITPTAARGIFNAIYFHKEVCWIITQINVLKPVRWRGFGTNEIDQCIRKRDVDKVLSENYQGDVMVTDERRLQFHNLILKDVAYVIHAYVGLLPQYRNRPQMSEQEHKEGVSGNELAMDSVVLLHGWVSVTTSHILMKRLLSITLLISLNLWGCCRLRLLRKMGRCSQFFSMLL